MILPKLETEQVDPFKTRTNKWKLNTNTIDLGDSGNPISIQTE